VSRKANPSEVQATDSGPEAALASLGYEQARDALVEVVRVLESGGATLEESLALWERGEALASRCEEWLAGARARLDAITATDDGA
jgi:exodeoxyribonuclease VII small subunit